MGASSFWLTDSSQVAATGPTSAEGERGVGVVDRRHDDLPRWKRPAEGIRQPEPAHLFSVSLPPDTNAAHDGQIAAQVMFSQPWKFALGVSVGPEVCHQATEEPLDL